MSKIKKLWKSIIDESHEMSFEVDFKRGWLRDKWTISGKGIDVSFKTDREAYAYIRGVKDGEEREVGL